MVEKTTETYYANELYRGSGYTGTDEDIAFIQKLTRSPEFNREYPFHEVFFLGDKLIHAIPSKNPGDLDNQVKRRQMYQELDDQLRQLGVERKNTFLVLTGGPMLGGSVEDFANSMAYQNS